MTSTWVRFSLRSNLTHTQTLAQRAARSCLDSPYKRRDPFKSVCHHSSSWLPPMNTYKQLWVDWLCEDCNGLLAESVMQVCVSQQNPTGKRAKWRWEARAVKASKLCANVRVKLKTWTESSTEGQTPRQLRTNSVQAEVSRCRISHS